MGNIQELLHIFNVLQGCTNKMKYAFAILVIACAVAAANAEDPPKDGKKEGQKAAVKEEAKKEEAKDAKKEDAKAPAKEEAKYAKEGGSDDEKTEEMKALIANKTMQAIHDAEAYFKKIKADTKGKEAKRAG